MARKVVTSYVDDLDGSEADGTVTFSLDGVAYEIDLSEANKGKLEKALEPFITAGRKTGGRRSSAAPRGKSDSAAIRVWAAEAGLDVPARGRIPAAVVEQYNNR